MKFKVYYLILPLCFNFSSFVSAQSENRTCIYPGIYEKMSKDIERGNVKVLKPPIDDVKSSGCSDEVQQIVSVSADSGAFCRSTNTIIMNWHRRSLSGDTKLHEYIHFSNNRDFVESNNRHPLDIILSVRTLRQEEILNQREEISGAVIDALWDEITAYLAEYTCASAGWIIAKDAYLKSKILPYSNQYTIFKDNEGLVNDLIDATLKNPNYNQFKNSEGRKILVDRLAKDYVK